MELKDIDFDDDDLKIDPEEQRNISEPEYDDDSQRSKRKPFVVVLLVLLFLVTTTLVAIAILYVGKDLFLREEQNVEQEVEPADPKIYTQAEFDEKLAEATKKAREEGEKDGEEIMKKMLREVSEESSGVLMLLRELYPDDMIFVSGSKYEYYPINRSLKQNTIDNELLKKDEETGMISYVAPDGAKSYICIDVSSFQKEINWDKVKAAGVDYAIIRVGFRGYGTGKMVEDTYYKSNIEEATSAGIKVGVYFFSQATTVEEAIEEADFVIERISPYEIDLPVAIDIEAINETARTDNLTNDDRSDFCVAFMDRVKAAGYEPMIYSNLTFFIRKMNMDKLEGYEKWFAFYNDSIYFPYDIGIWQYSATGTIDGISTDVDLNISFKDW